PGLLVDVERHDHVLQGRVGAILEGGCVIERREDDANGGGRLSAAWGRGHGALVPAWQVATCLAYIIPYTTGDPSGSIRTGTCSLKHDPFPKPGTHFRGSC